MSGDTRAERLARVIEKVRKLRALATSTNVHEAAAAAATAERLLLEHELSEAEIAGAGDEPRERAEPAGEHLDAHGANVTRWRSFLAAYLARVHGCTTWLEPHWSKETRNTAWKVRIAGRPSDVAIVRYLHTWLTAEILRLVASEGQGRGRSWRNSYAWGAVEGIRGQMDRARAEVRAAATGSALAVVDARLAEAEAVEPEKLRTSRKPTPVRDLAAHARGRRAGEALHLGAALDGAGDAAPAKLGPAR